jgi:hypothetical protein
LPALGHKVKVRATLPATVAKGAVPTWVQVGAATDLGVGKQPLDLAGVVGTIDVTKRLMTVSADGPGLSDGLITLTIPASISLGKNTIVAGEAVVVHATHTASGSFTLTGADADTGVSAADDLNNAIGDFLKKKKK